ncbi:MAG: hypothetical protein KC731_39570 [Myxococcales bacterium]|nr:hypothetical protein [Myxococcales bacterium]
MTTAEKHDPLEGMFRVSPLAAFALTGCGLLAGLGEFTSTASGGGGAGGSATGTTMAGGAGGGACDDAPDWQQVFSGEGTIEVQGLAPGPDCSVIVAVTAMSETGGGVVELPFGDTLSEDSYLVQIRRDGTIGWTTAIGGDGFQTVHAIHATSERVLVMGRFTSSLDVSGRPPFGDPGADAGFALQLDATTGEEIASERRLVGVSVNGRDEVFAGHFLEDGALSIAGTFSNDLTIANESSGLLCESARCAFWLDIRPDGVGALAFGGPSSGDNMASFTHLARLGDGTRVGVGQFSGDWSGTTVVMGTLVVGFDERDTEKFRYVLHGSGMVRPVGLATPPDATRALLLVAHEHELANGQSTLVNDQMPGQGRLSLLEVVGGGTNGIFLVRHWPESRDDARSTPVSREQLFAWEDGPNGTSVAMSGLVSGPETLGSGMSYDIQVDGIGNSMFAANLSVTYDSTVTLLGAPRVYPAGTAVQQATHVLHLAGALVVGGNYQGDAMPVGVLATSGAVNAFVERHPVR